MNLMKKKRILYTCIAFILFLIIYQFYFVSLLMSEPKQSYLNSNEKNNPINAINTAQFSNKNGLIRGILPIYFEKYKPNHHGTFKCIHSEEIILHEKVNDNYCDCSDGSDEPSTTACPNGVFYCSYQFPRAVKMLSVASSMINDGICDCCDGSDEWEPPKGFISYLTQGSKKLLRHRADVCPNVCLVQNQYVMLYPENK